MNEKPKERPRFIVGEIAKNWCAGVPLTPGTLGAAFEEMIAHNAARGYKLYDFTLSQLMTPTLDDAGKATDHPHLTETIIAVFEAVDGAPDLSSATA